MNRFRQALVITMAGLMVLTAPVSGAAAVTQVTWTAADQSKLTSSRAELAKQEVAVSQQLTQVGYFQNAVYSINKMIADSTSRLATLNSGGGDSASRQEISKLSDLIPKLKISLLGAQASLGKAQSDLDVKTAQVASSRAQIAQLQATQQLAAQQEADRVAAQKEAARVAKPNAIVALANALRGAKGSDGIGIMVNAAASGDPPLTKDDILTAMNYATQGDSTMLTQQLINPIRRVVQNSKTPGDSIVTLSISWRGEATVVISAAQQEANRLAAQQEADRVAKANAITALTKALFRVRNTSEVVALVNAAASGAPPLTKDDLLKALNDARAGVGQGGMTNPTMKSAVNAIRVLVQNSKTTGDSIVTLVASGNSKFAVVSSGGATGANGVTGDAGQPGASQTVSPVYVG